jgi:hypothetical protein
MLEQLSKPSMLEAFYHAETVTQFVTDNRKCVSGGWHSQSLVLGVVR